MSKGWMMVSAFGYGVLMSLALSGGVRIVGWLMGVEVTERLAGNVFLVGSLTLGPLFLGLYLRSLRAAAAEESKMAKLGARD